MTSEPALDARLHEAEQRYRTLVEQLPLVVYTDELTPHADAIYVSAQIETLLGYTAEEWLADPKLWVGTIHPDDREWVLADVERTYVRGEPSAPIEYRMIARDGRTVWVRDDASAVRTEDGRSLYMHGFLLDITEQKRAEALLRRQDAILRAVARGAERLLQEPMWETALPDVLRWLGDAAAVGRVYLYENYTTPDGVLRARLRGECCGPDVPPTDAHAFWRDFGYDESGFGPMAESLSHGGNYAAHTRELLPGAAAALEAIETVSILSVPVVCEGTWWGFFGFDECGSEREWGDAETDALRTAAGILGAAIERDRSGERLRRRKQHLRAVFENTLDAIAIFDDGGHFLDANPAALDLLAVSRRDLLARRVVDFTLPEDRRALPGIWRRFLAEGSLEFEFEVARADGERRSVEIAAKASFLPGRHIAVVRDVTERKRLERELGRSQRLESLGRLAGGIAHDFNNLLTAISGYAGLLLEKSHADPSVAHDLREIERATARAAELTGQLLAFGRRQALRPEPVDLNAAVREVEPMLRRLLGADVELVASLEPGLGVVRVDVAHLEQAIVNLVVNARDAMGGPGGRLTIATGNAEWEQLAGVAGIEPRPYVAITVSDTGTGMDEETASRVFEPFFTTKEEGTGLGLASVYGMAQQSGGTVTIATVPGEGSSFTILLPRIEERAAAREDPAVSPRRLGGSETILLVEDEEAVRTLVRRILEGSGYTVLEAPDGETAVRLAGLYAGPIDLLLTDVVMPRMRGTELASHVTAARPGTPVVFMSGYAHEAVSDGGLPEGCTFLAKPFGTDELTQAVREVLDARATLRP